MALIIDILGSGSLETQVTPSGNRLYFPGTDKGALIKSILIQNTSATTISTVTLKVRPAPATSNTDDKYIAPVESKIPPNGELALENEITLSGDDSIIGFVDSGTSVNYIINGVERNQNNQ